MKRRTKIFLKKQIAIVLCILITMCSLSVTGFATSKSQTDALNWVKSQVGQSLEYDYDEWRYQCVDFIKHYYAYLGVSPVNGNGCDYAWNSLPSGWTRVQGGTPQPGDILVYSGNTNNTAGHVAIYESDYSHYHQNFDTHSYVERITRFKYNQLDNPYWGYIRPNWSSGSGSDFSYFTSVSASNITETDAKIEATIIGTSLSTCGFYIGKSTSSMTKKTETVNGYVENIWYIMSSDYGQLEPGTTYYYKFFITVGGTEYCSEVKSFKTTAQTIHSGTCGTNLTWTFNETTGILAVSGTGDMDDYSSTNSPWESYEDSIKKVVINNGVTSIGSYAFNFCENLTNVTIPDSVKTIGEDAFYRTGLVSVTIPNGVTSIEVSAFSYCESLTSVTIPDSVTSISNNAFYSCTNLTQISLPDSITSIGGAAFSDTGYYNDSSNWEDGVLYIDNHLIWANNDITGSYTIKDGTKCIAAQAFWCCENLEGVTIPDSVTSIGYSAFDYCESITSITIPASVTSIGSAFGNCKSLSSFTVDKNNPCYSGDEYGVLYNKDKTTLVRYPMGNTRTHFSIPDSVTVIDTSSFSRCSNLTNVTIPDSVSEIKLCAFQFCTGITEIIIPDGITEIERDTFYFCFALTDVTIPDSVISIGSEAFYNCKNLVNIAIPDSVTSIDYGAFGLCERLTSIIIPDSVTSIVYETFYGSNNLADVYYIGTEEQWNSIPVSSHNDPLLNAKIHFCEKIAEKSATCEEEGYTEGLYCSDCKEYVIGHEDISVLGHNLGEWKTTTAATCTAKGMQTRYCSRCDKTETREISMLAHKYQSAVTAPTCTSQGYTTYTCSCGDSYISDYVPAKGHTDGSWVVTKPATTTQSGIKTLYCLTCGMEIRTEIIPAVTTGKVHSVSVSGVSLNYKSSTTLTPQIVVDSGVKYTVTYLSSNSSVASVDANGRVSTHETGSTTITCTVTDEHGNTVTDTCNVEVKYTWWQWIIVIVLFGWIWY